MAEHAQELAGEFTGHRAPPAPTRVAEELTGDLPCIRCTYNLRGLSVRQQCPECGLPVLATILGVIDPAASELQPIRRPRLVAALFLAWPALALLAAVLAWAVHLAPMAREAGLLLAAPPWAARASVALLLLSGGCAGVLVRPHAQIPRAQSWAAAAGVALSVPLALVHGWLLAQVLATTTSPYLSPHGLPLERHLWRLASLSLTVLVILALRPNARLLAARSLVVRTGRVDRQPLLALAGAAALAAVGDLVGLLGHAAGAPVQDFAAPLGSFLIAVGSLLLTIGIAGILLDTIRLAPVILEPPLGPEQAFGPRP